MKDSLRLSTAILKPLSRLDDSHRAPLMDGLLTYSLGRFAHSSSMHLFGVQSSIPPYSSPKCFHA